MAAGATVLKLALARPQQVEGLLIHVARSSHEHEAGMRQIKPANMRFA